MEIKNVYYKNFDNFESCDTNESLDSNLSMSKDPDKVADYVNFGKLLTIRAKLLQRQKDNASGTTKGSIPNHPPSPHLDPIDVISGRHNRGPEKDISNSTKTHSEKGFLDQIGIGKVFESVKDSITGKDTVDKVFKNPNLKFNEEFKNQVLDGVFHILIKKCC